MADAGSLMPCPRSVAEMEAFDALPPRYRAYARAHGLDMALVLKEDDDWIAAFEADHAGSNA